MLLTFPLARGDGFSIELFGGQNNSTNTVPTASSVSNDTHSLERKGTCESLSLWASLKSLATMNIKVVKYH